jgi:hypothetical protein
MEKCEHEPCRCQVDEAGGYCSDHCRDMQASNPQANPEPCRCGHDECMTE